MDRIPPIGPPGPDPQPVEPVVRRQDESERPEPERERERRRRRPPDPPGEEALPSDEDEDEGPHVDVIACPRACRSSSASTAGPSRRSAASVRWPRCPSRP